MRCPFATWTPVPGCPGGDHRGGPGKGVAHKTQGSTLAAALAAYRAKGCPPHFTIDERGGLHQHVDTDRSSYALRNPAGGVETNRDGAVQVEIVGFSGRGMTAAQTATMRRLMGWLEDAERVPWRWPAGRPPQTERDGYGERNGHRDARLWDGTGGWYGHSQVPENAHWDPAWTDVEWSAVASRGPAGSKPAPAAQPQEDDDMDPQTTPVPLGPGNRTNLARALRVAKAPDRWTYQNAAEMVAATGARTTALEDAVRQLAQTVKTLAARVDAVTTAKVSPDIEAAVRQVLDGVQVTLDTTPGA